MPSNQTGRPAKIIDQKDFESLMVIQCSLEEVTAFFDNKLGGCSVDTIERWCKKTYGQTFAEISAKKRNLGKISLRRSQFELAKKSAAMGIWLGKQYLGQSEQPIKGEFELSTREDELSKSLKELAQELESDE